MKVKIYLISAVLCWVIIYIFFLFPHPAWQVWHGKSVDIFLRHRHANTARPAQLDRIVIVGLDEEVYTRLNSVGNIGRRNFAYFLKKMRAEGVTPAVVGFDVAFKGVSNSTREDVFLLEAMRSMGNVVLSNYYTRDGVLYKNPEQFGNVASAIGFINFAVDRDLVVRRMFRWHLANDFSLSYPLATQVFARFRKSPVESALSALPRFSREMEFKKNLQSVGRPGGNSGVRINYLGDVKDFKIVSMWAALTDSKARAGFNDKIVLIGSIREIDHDIHPTPFGPMPGVLVHANFLLSLLNDRPLKDIPFCISMFVLLAAGVLVALGAFSFNNIHAGLLVAGLSVVGFGFSLQAIKGDFVFDFFGYMLTLVLAYGGGNIGRAVVVQLERNELRRLAMTDALTGLYAYRYFEPKFKMEIEAARTGKTGLALVIYDIDNFKKINDTYGHETGNEVLRQTARVMRNNFSRQDTICRYGGEEFVVILPGTQEENALKVANRIREAVANHVFVHNEQTIKVTVSAGVACLGASRSTVKLMIEQADRALYVSKTSGKNRATLASDGASS